MERREALEVARRVADEALEVMEDQPEEPEEDKGPEVTDLRVDQVWTKAFH